MTERARQVLAQAMDLTPTERAELVEQILASFDLSAREEIDALWAKEAEDRIDAFDEGKIGASPASEVFRRIDRQGRP